MMICFNCSGQTKAELEMLVSVGSYRDYSDAIAAAIRNQLMMEQEVATEGTILMGNVPTAEQSLAPVKPATPMLIPQTPFLSAPPAVRQVPKTKRLPTVKEKSPTNGATAKETRPSPAIEGGAIVVPGIPDIFKLDGFPRKPPEGLANLGTDMWASGQVVPLDRWVLGQQNRLFPAKANARALIRMFIAFEKKLPVGKTVELIAADAARFGDYLIALDQQQESSRDDSFATAFPTTGEDTDKSRTRYANQFMVYVNTRGEVSGLMADLKLVNFTFVKKERYIVPTRVAWSLARLPNPVIDSTNESPNGKFSPDEKRLLIEHILQSVPVEAFAYRAVLDAIARGHDTPEKIDAALRAYVSDDRAEKLSQSFLASQRSGAVSRMSDLDLVERQRSGIRVCYAVTDAGREFLARSTVPTK